MSKYLFLLAFCGLLTIHFSLEASAQSELEDTEESFFDSAEESEPLPQLSPQLSEEDDVVEMDQEPVPRIQRSPEVTPRSIGKPHRVRHPLAEKGLIRITKEKTYIYKTARSPQKHAFAFKLGMFDPVNLENPDNGATFEDNYPEASGPMLLLEYEWQLFQWAIGKIGLKAGSGLFYANGNGRFKSGYAENQGLDPKEVFTFLAFPNSVGLVYRAQFWDKQLLVPYVDGGAIGFTFAEFRDDGGSPKFGFSPAAYGAAGLGVNLSSFDSISAFNLDREYGINSVFLVAEYRNVLSLGGKFDLSSDIFSGGFLMEF